MGVAEVARLPGRTCRKSPDFRGAHAGSRQTSGAHMPEVARLPGRTCRKSPDFRGAHAGSRETSGAHMPEVWRLPLHPSAMRSNGSKKSKSWRVAGGILID